MRYTVIVYSKPGPAFYGLNVPDLEVSELQRTFRFKFRARFYRRRILSAMKRISLENNLVGPAYATITAHDMSWWKLKP